MNYKQNRAELHRRRYLERLESFRSKPTSTLSTWKLMFSLAMFLVLAFVALPWGLSYLHRTTSQLAQQNDNNDLQVTELIQKVEDQLAESERQRINKKRGTIFRVKSFDLEINFVIRQSTSQKGTTTYSVVAVDNQIESSTEMTHKLTLHLEVPQLPPGKAVLSSTPPTGQQIITIGEKPHSMANETR